jgi:short-subunit dehydrogenase
MRDAGGHVLTMEGAGPGGNATASYVAYGSTKRAVPQFVASPSGELAASKVRFHVLSPGMVC